MNKLIFLIEIVFILKSADFLIRKNSKPINQISITRLINKLNIQLKLNYALNLFDHKTWVFINNLHSIQSFFEGTVKEQLADVLYNRMPFIAYSFQSRDIPNRGMCGKRRLIYNKTCI